MRKFVVQSKKGKSSIVEVECEVIQGVEDPSVLWIPAGEYRARILSPETFHPRKEQVVDGKPTTVLTLDVWYSHAFYPSIEAAKLECEKSIRYELIQFAVSKHRAPATEEQVQEALSKIETIRL